MSIKFSLTVAFLFTSLYAAGQANWSLDQSFGTNGKVHMTMPTVPQKAGAYISMLQPDGKIIAGGNTYDNRHIVLMRFNPDGSLDSSFGTAGVVETGAGPWNSISEMIGMDLQSDGKIVVGGNVHNPTNPNSDFDFLLARYNANGSIDSSFGTNGEVITDVNNEENWGASVAVQPDGKILLGGTAFFATVILRFNANGSPDATFGTGGQVVITLDNNYWSGFPNLLLQPDGKIIGAGQITDSTTVGMDMGLVRFNTDGSLDLGFGTGGGATIDAGSFVEGIADVILQPDGKILAGGWGMDSANYEDCRLVRFMPDGTPDSSFGTNGAAVVSWSSETDLIKGIALQPDGKIIASGEYFTGPTLASIDYDFFVTRYLSDGTPDTSFGNSGLIVTSFNSKYDIAKDVLLQADGRIVVVGESGVIPSFALARYAMSSVASVAGPVNQSITGAFVYPNPVAGDRFHLSYEVNEAGPVTVRLTSLSGAYTQTLLKDQSRLPGRHTETMVLPAYLAAGVYLLEIRSNEDLLSVRIMKR
jgi:uncharacterized delta-60 repeat protein